jgi:Alpha/beta hydrolase of unknown function (DUF900)
MSLLPGTSNLPNANRSARVVSIHSDDVYLPIMLSTRITQLAFPSIVLPLEWLIIVFLLCAQCMAQVEDAELASSDSSFPNIKIPTLGGKQFWTDHSWRNGWRLQRNALTSHWRLLDENNFRQAWGSRTACENALNEAQPQITSPNERAIFLMHGLGRSASSMKSLKNHLTADGFETIVCPEYASSRESISQHALALREMIAGFPNHIRFDFIGHSMGNIVVRHAIGDWMREGNLQVLNRIDHVVMLGPPNQGASIARQLAKTGVFGWIAGEGGLELGAKWEKFEEKLAIPTCPFGIIAGRLPEKVPANPLVGGEGDFVVSVEETRLPGAADFLEVPVLHSFLMDDAKVQQAVANFLRDSKFK